MNFYTITTKVNIDTNQQLRQACRSMGIKYKELNPYQFSFSNFRPFEKGDLFYRVATTKSAVTLEKYILNEKVVTFYDNNIKKRHNYMNNTIIHIDNNLPIPKTVPGIAVNKNKIEKDIKKLGGFPLILKVLGSSHGKGVIKVDSLSAFYSAYEYLKSKDEIILIREFIPVTSSARLIVLGNKVIDSIEYNAPRGDFRSNASYIPNVAQKKFPKTVQQIAIKAVKSLGYEFGGVDILINKNKFYLAEANFPCFFSRAQMTTNTDIAGQMINYLINKYKKKYGRRKNKKNS